MAGRAARGPRARSIPGEGRRSPAYPWCVKAGIVLLLASVASGLVATPAGANIPNAQNSSVAPRLVTCPAGDSTFVVLTRDVANNLWCDEDVEVDLCSCGGYHLSLAGTHPYAIDATGCRVSMRPDCGTGLSAFPLAGGGLCPGDTIVVRGNGVPLRFVTAVASLDQDGNLLVDQRDVTIVQSKVGAVDPTADFDGDGTVTATDVAIVEAHLGHHAPEALAVPLPAPGGLALSAPGPNPFARATRFTLTLGAAAPADVAIVDLSGRRVATLFHGDLPAGSREFAWLGRSAGGATARSGVYIVQARVDGTSLARRVVFLSGR